MTRHSHKPGTARSAGEAPAPPRKSIVADPVERDSIRILPGEFHATRGDITLTTVLGSCVSACLWDPTVPAGGMNHFMLSGASTEEAAASARYGLFAMEKLINELIKLGAQKRNLRAKVFGGGRVLKNMTALNVGARNAKFVLEFLANEGIPILGKDLEDVFARKVVFYPASGRALVKRIDPASDSTVINSEREYSKTLEKKPVAGDIELF